jgi:uncharacterized membrane protein HdeD (DUF308 family)
MSLLTRFNEEHLPSFHQSSGKFLLIGILLTILGIIAIGAAALTTFLSVIFLGTVLVIAGIFLLMDSFTFWRSKNGFLVHFLVSLLYFLAGVMLIANPIVGSVSITLLLGIVYVIAGIFRISFSSGVQSPHWGWTWFNGIITLLIGLLILTSWPASSLFVIGLFVGIDLVFIGLAYAMASCAGSKAMKAKKMAR